MSQHDSTVLVQGAVMLAVIGLVLLRTLRTRRIDHGRLLRMPLIFGAIGLISLRTGVGSTGAVVMLGGELVLAFALGLARGATSTVWRDQDGWWTKGTALTLVLWVLSFGIRVAAVPLGRSMGVAEGASTGAIFLVLGVSFAAQNLVIARRTDALQGANRVSA